MFIILMIIVVMVVFFLFLMHTCLFSQLQRRILRCKFFTSNSDNAEKMFLTKMRKY
uniref:Uncharacterized protein n=1 Tax=Anguilla anguilla TaxID=7936 RepID=A0A0E9SIR9_ANGAN